MTMRMAKGWVAAAALATAGIMAVPALAQDRGDGHGGRASRLVELLDTNQDGKVSLDEVRAEQERLFKAADVDGDGKLSEDEFRRRGRLLMSLRVMSFFDLLDANGDRSLTVDEINAPSSRWFSRYDANGDRAIEPSELPSARGSREGARQGMPGAPGMQGRPGTSGGAGGPGMHGGPGPGR